MAMLLALPIAITTLLTLVNLDLLFRRPGEGRDRALWILEPFGLLFGGFSFWRMLSLYRIEWRDGDEAIFFGNRHSPIAKQYLPTLAVLAVIAVFGYVLLRYFPLRRLPPLLSVLSMGAVVIGLVFLVFLSCQFGLRVGILCQVYLVNCMVIAIRVLNDTVIRFARGECGVSRFSWLNRLTSRALLLPPLALLAALPVLLIVVCVMMLFGQQPDGLIRVWTETADWTFSQMTPPPSIPYEGHYLCTVAAGGHRKLVKPLRTGKRNGHTVVVNRQLCVANAFEDLLKERLPRFHRVVRSTYDAVGLPIAKRVKRPLTCDVIYLLMKPAEWLFLVVLYLFDSRPEDRIAVQYPHLPFRKEERDEA